MKNLTWIARVWPVGLFMALGCTLGCPGNNPGKVTPDVQLAKIQSDLSALDQKLTQIQQELKPLDQNNSPIKVRGGAMTFYTKKGNKWFKSGNGWCASVDTSQISFNGFDDVPDGPLQQTLTGDWTIAILGGNPSNGILMQSGSNCNGSGLPSVTITPTGHGDFYTSDLNLGTGGKSNKRYRDISPSCGTATTTNDEDACERMTSITITDSAKPQPYKKIGTCSDLDCSVFIGK
jgi:hypothetical protein